MYRPRIVTAIFAILMSLCFIHAGCVQNRQAERSLKEPAESAESPKANVSPGPGQKTGHSDAGKEAKEETGVVDANGDGIPDSPSEQEGNSSEENGPEAAGVNLPKGWPSDVSIMAGFTITVSADKGDGGLLVGATGDKPVAEVADFYRRLSGWQVFSDSITNPTESRPGRSMVLTKKKATLNIVIGWVKSGTQLNLTYKKG